MNKLTILGVPINRLCVIVLFLLMSSNSFAQEEIYTTIRKNVNPLAFDLDHNLSNKQDSLLLDSKFLFKKVRFLNKTTERVFDFKPAVKRAKISLEDLPLGKYTVMFYQADKIIVFQIDRLLPFDYEHAYDSDVASNELSDVKLDTDVALADVKDKDLDFDTPNLSMGTRGRDEEYDSIEESMSMSYNLSEPDRSKVQTRAEYRRTHLRPNGKPYND
ncbi:hypothetical protein [Psychroserpens algicola]|uniref:DUF4138 domain-containing protein n=1 Tax=Psychroserpens algicola TaxID=1719034 RepID=A0ABT0H6U4_9FLAO|nr:hypothetical protein [Psychroserpens algicola]MCK8480104.1 hypothetical protein [Psychroserpens algicola]